MRPPVADRKQRHEAEPGRRRDRHVCRGQLPEGVAISPTGMVWVVNHGNATPGRGVMESNVTMLDLAGTTIATVVAGSLPEIIVMDAAGHAWISNKGNGTAGAEPLDSNVMELDSSGAVVGTYAGGSYPYGIAIDRAGNVWVTNWGNGIPGTDPGCSNYQVYVEVASGPQYFPGPPAPSCPNHASGWGYDWR